MPNKGISCHIHQKTEQKASSRNICSQLVCSFAATASKNGIVDSTKEVTKGSESAASSSLPPPRFNWLTGHRVGQLERAII